MKPLEVYSSTAKEPEPHTRKSSIQARIYVFESAILALDWTQETLEQSDG